MAALRSRQRAAPRAPQHGPTPWARGTRVRLAARADKFGRVLSTAFSGRDVQVRWEAKRSRDSWHRVSELVEAREYVAHPNARKGARSTETPMEVLA